MSIRKIERADGVRFQVYGRAEGKKIYVGTFDTQREAKAADEDQRSAERKAKRGELPPDVNVRRTLDQALDAWLTSIEAQRSHDEYQTRLRVHVRPVLGARPLDEVTEGDVETLRNTLAKSKKPNTVNGVIAALMTAMTWMERKRWITTNPCRLVRKVEVQQRSFTWLRTSEQVTKLLSHCTNSIRDLVAVLVGTGLRIDEALHLRWEDIDLDHRLIHVQRGRRGPTKSGRLRHVPILDSVLGVIKAMRLARGSDTGWLWPGAKGKPRIKTSINKPFHNAREAAGVSDLRIHDLRHTFAGLFLVDGGDIFRLSKILGHSSVAITEKVYAHLRPDAFEVDYGRVRFAMPNDGSNVIKLQAQ